MLDFWTTIGPRKSGRFETLFRFANSHSIMTTDLMSLSCATTPHPSCFFKSQRYSALNQEFCNERF